jgi:hypothetical protein
MNQTLHHASVPVLCQPSVDGYGGGWGRSWPHSTKPFATGAVGQRCPGGSTTGASPPQRLRAKFACDRGSAPATSVRIAQCKADRALRAILAFLAALALCHGPAFGDEPADAPPADDEKARLQAAQRHVRQLDLRRVDADSQLIELIDHPLLSFGDPARMHQRGSFWGWQPTGRPAAFLELWQNADQPELWRHSITLSSSERVSLDAAMAGRWTPPQTPLETPAISDGPAPAKDESGRLRQLRELARRFTAHEFWDPDNSRFELRLLAQPVHRYSEPAGGIQDGAVFILAHDTNPEIVLLIEAHGESAASSHWHYTLVPTSSAEVHVELDGKEVWHRPRAPGIVGGPTQSYWLFRLPAEADQ